MEDLQKISENLRHCKDDVLRDWELRVRERLRATRDEPHSSIRNSVPVFLDDLATGLEEGLPKVCADIIHFAHKHGSERAHNSHYSIEDALTEYKILRQVIFEHLEKDSPLPPEARDIIIEGIHVGMAKAAAEFAKLARERSAEASNLLETVLNQLPAGVTITSVPSGEILRRNQKANELFPAHFEVYRLNGAPLSPHDYPTNRTMRTGQFVAEQVTIKRPDQTKIHVKLKSAPILDHRGHMFAVATIIHDITEIKEKELDLKVAVKKLKQITDTQPTLIAQVDRDLRYIFVNKAYEEWFGVSSDKIIGLTLKEIAGEEIWKGALPYYQRALAGEKVTFEATAPYRTGSRHVVATYCPGYNAKGEVDSVFISVLDITEQKATLDALHEETVLRDKFVSTLSHDLRTPLTAAKMSAELLKRKITDDKANSYSTRIIENLNRADKMIADLLDASRVRAGKEIVVQPCETDVSSIIRHTLEDLSTIHGNRFEYSVKEKVLAWIDPLGIRRILENLCTNAIKYGSPSENVKVTLTHNDHDLFLSVHNEGHPLLNVDKRKLFEPFHRGEGTARTEGWGIGLTIVRGITEAHCGDVNIDTSAKGTTFTIRLPLDLRRAREESQHLH